MKRLGSWFAVAIAAAVIGLSAFGAPVPHCEKVESTPVEVKATPLERVKTGFNRTFVEEQRWKLILRGFGVSLLIAKLAMLFGTFLSFGVWLLVTSRNRILSSIGKGYVAVLQGTPALVVLMVMYYVVFGNIEINGVWVAVLVFTMNLSAYGGMLLKTSVETVGDGQAEAAYMLGFTPSQTFFRIILPQAMKVFMPVYRGQLVELMKGTAVVGYIAIQDITKICDMIRGKTNESFFPLIVVAIVYFLTTQLLITLLKFIEHKIGARK